MSEKSSNFAPSNEKPTQMMKTRYWTMALLALMTAMSACKKANDLEPRNDKLPVVVEQIPGKSYYEVEKWLKQNGFTKTDLSQVPENVVLLPLTQQIRQRYRFAAVFVRGENHEPDQTRDYDEWVAIGINGGIVVHCEGARFVDNVTVALNEYVEWSAWMQRTFPMPFYWCGYIGYGLNDPRTRTYLRTEDRAATYGTLEEYNEDLANLEDDLVELVESYNQNKTPGTFEIVYSTYGGVRVLKCNALYSSVQDLIPLDGPGQSTVDPADPNLKPYINAVRTYVERVFLMFDSLKAKL